MDNTKTQSKLTEIKFTSNVAVVVYMWVVKMSQGSRVDFVIFIISEITRENYNKT